MPFPSRLPSAARRSQMQSSREQRGPVHLEVLPGTPPLSEEILAAMKKKV